MVNIISIVFVVSGLVAAVIIAFDVRRNPQSMRIMSLVWVLTALWGGWAALWAYLSFGRQKRLLNNSTKMKMQTGAKMQMGHNVMESVPMRASMSVPTGASMSVPMRASMSVPTGASMSVPMGASMSVPTGASMSVPMGASMSPMSMERPRWQSTMLSTLHCGAGCTLADVIGEGVLWFIPLSIGGSLIVGGWVFDYILALCIGVVFQYIAIRSMQKVSKRSAAVAALKADFLSLTAWQIGMYCWLSLVFFVLMRGVEIPKLSWIFWFMMQIAMAVGFIVAWPVNVWLIHKGVKKGM